MIDHRDIDRLPTADGAAANAKSTRQIEALMKAVARAPRSLLMLDYDGTLAPFRLDPDEALPYPDIAALLQAIIRTGKTRVVIISGRQVEDVIPLLGVTPQPEIWGLHGLQRLMPNGNVVMLPLEKRTIDALATAETALRSEHLEHIAEFKAGSIAVHWRGRPEAEVAVLRSRVLLNWDPIAKNAGLHLLEFDGGLELCASEADKGDAVRTVLKEMNPDIPAAYLGDDSTDETAFEALEGHGLSVLVRPRWRSTAALVWLRPPDEILNFLTQWLEACRTNPQAMKRKLE